MLAPHVPRGTLSLRLQPAPVGDSLLPMEISTIEVIARGVMVHEGKVLLCQNRKQGHCFLPGGHVDFNEPTSTALLREVREELGIELNLGRFLGVFESAFDQLRKKGQGSRRHHEINLVFELLPLNASAFNPATLISQEDHIQFIWTAIDSLGAPGGVMVLPQGIEAIIRLANQPSKEPAGGPQLLSHFS